MQTSRHQILGKRCFGENVFDGTASRDDGSGERLK
jgi:hypothetical protein